MLIGVVGKANVGKSTFFKAATLMDIEIANYPFATIKPNHGIGFVKIKDVAREFDKTADPREGFILDKYRFVSIDMIDVAGLVPGAHEGKGMGSQFLNDLNQADALIHVIDVSGSTNEKGEPVPKGTYDSSKDIKFLEEELDYWYLSILKRGWDKFAKQVQQENSEIDKALAKQLSGLGVDQDMVKKGIKSLNLKDEPVNWNEDELFKLSSYLRRKTKPMLIAANKIDVPGAEENYKKLRDEFPDKVIMPCSAESELALKEAAHNNLIKYIPGETDFTITEEGKKKLNDKQKKALEFIKENVLKKFVEGTGIQNILNNLIFSLLDYIAIHPGGVNKLEDQDGNVLPDCFLMKNGSTALNFAYRLHSDFGDNFIKCLDVRTNMTHGKEYKLKHLDILKIAANN